MTFHVRRRDKEITDEALMKSVLKSAEYVTLAFSRDNQPYLVSLSHSYDEARNCIFFHCATDGKKLYYIRSNNLIWGQALLDYGYSQGECTHLYASVHFSGKVKLLEKLEEKRQAMGCLIRKLDKNPEALMTSLSPERLNRVIIGRIDIAYMSGKKSKEITV